MGQNLHRQKAQSILPPNIRERQQDRSLEPVRSSSLTCSYKHVVYDERDSLGRPIRIYKLHIG